MWPELKGMAQAYAMAVIRFPLVYRNESDSVAIQREHGNWNEPACRPGVFDFIANATSVKVGFLPAHNPSLVTVENMRQSAHSACTRIFGKE
jgi:hypothetical protein